MAKSPAKIDWVALGGGCAILLAGLLAYARSGSGPLVFDDQATIADNPTLRHLWPLGLVLRPLANGSPVTGRPLVNLSLAINYALGGTGVRGYHAVNLFLHLLAGLTLFGIARRTLSALPRPSPVRADGRTELPPTLGALAAALIWTVHPLQTESVTYISGRTESLVGVFYLATLYSFVRATESRKNAAAGPGWPARLWLGLTVAFSFAGMAAKEVMATAPFIVLLYDRTFVAGGFREAWRKRRGFYLLLGSSWLWLAWLVAGAAARGGTVGFHTGVPWWRYAEIQGQAIAHYLRLSFWPHPLMLDYGSDFVGPAGVLLRDGVVVAGLLAASVIALWRRPPLGFLGAWFFAILAPSSSVVPVATELVAEHRMYLPLAAVCLLAIVGLYRLLGSKSCLVWIGVTMGLSLLTARRNQDYRSAESLWRAAVRAAPGNAWAHNNLGGVLLASGNRRTAILEFNRALQLDPLAAGTHNNLGLALAQENRLEEAMVQYEEAVHLAPTYPAARENLAAALLKFGRLPEAIAQYREALRLRPGEAEPHHNLALALDKAGWLPEALAEYREALRLHTGSAKVHYDLGNVLVRLRRLPEAIVEFEDAVRIQPDYAEARGNLGGALLQTGRLKEAVMQYQEALRLKPGLVEAYVNLGSAFLEQGRPDEAIASYRAAVRLRSDYSVAHYDLGVALRSVGKLEEAAVQFETASRLQAGR